MDVSSYQLDVTLLVSHDQDCRFFFDIWYLYFLFSPQRFVFIFHHEAWEDSHGSEEKVMMQVLFLPHQILGCLAAAGKMELVAGDEVPWLNIDLLKANYKHSPVRNPSHLRRYQSTGRSLLTHHGTNSIRYFQPLDLPIGGLFLWQWLNGWVITRVNMLMIIIDQGDILLASAGLIISSSLL